MITRTLGAFSDAQNKCSHSLMIRNDLPPNLILMKSLYCFTIDTLSSADQCHSSDIAQHKGKKSQKKKSLSP